MKPFLKTGCLLQDVDTKTYYRVYKAIESIGEVYLTSISEDLKKIVLPEKYHLPTISKKFDEGKLLVPEKDPMLRLLSDDNVTQNQKSYARRAYAEIEDIVSNEANDVLLDPSQRYYLIEKASNKEKGSSIPTIIKWLKQWCAGRMMESALLPDFHKCGGAGKSRATRTYNQAHIELVAFGFQRYFLDEASGTSTVKEAHKKTLKHHWKTELHGETEISEDIFRRIANEVFPDAYENKVRRRNKRNAAREGKVNRGRATDIADGPGTLFQIDWTKMDVHLVASCNRTLWIGRPILYVVVDTHSRLVTGILITLQTPKFWTFCQAIYYAAMDKVKLCAMFGLSIKEGDWLGECVPLKYIADNGEAGGKMANVLGENIKVGLGNVQSYRGDFKPIVERLNLTIKSEIKPLTVDHGHIVDRYGKRLGIDPRKEACITLEELYQIAFRVVMEYNASPMPSYPDLTDLTSELVDKTPNAIWEWAERIGYGIRKHHNEKELWMDFFEKKKRTPTSDGFLIQNHHFVPESEDDIRLLENLTNKPNGAGKQFVIYDENCFKQRFWFYEGRLIPLRKIGADEQEFSNIWEMIELDAYHRERDRQIRTQRKDVTNERSRANEALVKSAKEKQGDGNRVNTTHQGAARDTELQDENNRHQQLAPSFVQLPQEPKEETADEELESPFSSAFKTFKSRKT